MAEIQKKLKELEVLTEKTLSQAQSVEELEKLRIDYLGRKGRITSFLKEVKNLPPEKRPQVGKLANQLKQKVAESLSQKLERLRKSEKQKKISGEFFDYTLPGRKIPLGKLHPLTLVTDELTNIFYGMGFEVALGPDVETDYYNFEALNFEPDHPARDMQDTFYVDEQFLLRTHTSPVQVRVFEKRKPPVRIIAPGRCYRHEAINARSYCVFHQIEGFYVDKKVTFADLKGVLSAFVWEFFGPEVKLRFRPSFFPFTEPSAEVDITCFLCKGKGCSLCKRKGWLEILGAGMIDPAVFEHVGYDPEIYSGYAFGMGVERIAMLKYGIDDIRLFYENDLRFLRQF